eukprot:1405402-Alexandrium_andersonii.AAC.1
MRRCLCCWSHAACVAVYVVVCGVPVDVNTNVNIGCSIDVGAHAVACVVARTSARQATQQWVFVLRRPESRHVPT